jgi:dipeptidyl aminopeptidase/acylaminoacyl peptidase
MANWIGANTTRFRAIVSHAGLFALSSFHGVTDVPAWWAAEIGGTPWQTGLDEYDRYSPHRDMSRWTTPTLIVHGEMDYRVPISEALALFEGLQARGVRSELLVFPDENHWILRPRNSVAWYEAVLGFVERHFA